MKSKIHSRLFFGLSSITLAFCTSIASGVTETFNTAGTVNWVCPAGVTSVQVECWGGGGAGGSAQRTTASAGGGGGGGGAYAKRIVVPVTTGNTYAVTIPAAAVAPTSGFTATTRVSGTNVTFTGDSAVSVTANGGQGGQCGVNSTGTLGSGGAAGAVGVGLLDAAFAGGNGSTNTSSNAGAGGSGASDLGNGNNGSGSTAGATKTGTDAAHNGGAGGSGKTGAGDGNGGATIPGGAGGGAKTITTTNAIGSPGARGQITLTYTITVATVVKADNSDPLNTGTSWVGGSVPGGAGIGTWNNTVSLANTTSALGGDLTLGGIAIADPAGPITISTGNTLTLGSLPLDIDMSAATQNLSMNCNLALGAANIWDVASTKTLTLGGIVSGSSDVTIQGAGTTILSGANTYTGSSTVTGGTLDITGSLTGSTTTTKLNIRPASGNAVVNYSGGTSTLHALAGSNVAGTSSVFNMTAGNLTISPGVATGNQSVTGAGNGIGSGAYGYYNITGGVFKDTNRFTLSGQASGNPTSSAATTIQTGVVHVGGTGTIDQTNGEWWLSYGLGQTTVTGSGTIDRTGSTNPFAIFMNHSTGVTGGGYGVLNLAGANAQVILGTQPIRFGNSSTAGQGEGQSGFVNLAAGTLSVGANSNINLPAAPSVINNAYYNFAGGTLKATANLSGWIPVSTAAINFNSNLFGPIDNTGSSTDFNGGLNVDTNTFDVTIANPLQAPAGAGVTQADLSVSGGSGYVGAPAVIFSSTGVIAGGSPAAGYALISGGAVTGIVITAPGNYTVGTVPTISLIGGGGTGASVSVAALNSANTSGGLTKTNTGTLTLTGANTYTGPTLISGGTLQLNSTAATNPITSNITANSGGSLAFTSGTASNLNLAGKTLTLGGGNLSIDIGNTAVNDSLTVNDLTLTANSTVSLKPIGAINSGGSYTLLTSTNPIVTGGFSLTATPVGRLSGAVTVNTNTVTITPTLFEGIWNQTGGGTWSTGDPNVTAGNWTNYKPTLAGDAALFGSAIATPSTVNVDAAHTLGFIRFDNANAYTIGTNGSSNLTLDNGTSNAFALVNSGSHTIAENVALTSSLLVAPLTGTTLTISGNLSGTGTGLQLVDAGTLVLSGTANSYTGATNVSNGTLNLAGALTGGGTVNVTGGLLNITSPTNFALGTTTVATGGILEISGSATYSIATRMSVGATSATTGTVNQTGGTVSFTASDALLVGTNAASNSTGIYNLSGGTLTCYSAATRGVILGVNDGTNGTFNLSGTGNLDLPASALFIGRSDVAMPGCTALFTQSGASSTATVNVLSIGGTGTGNTTSTMSLSAGTFVANTFTKLSTATNDVSIINISGTADVTLPAFPTTRGAGATATINFDGGTLRPNATSATYMGGLTNAFIKAGGVKFDTGFDITVAQDLLTDPVSTGGGLTKNGTGGSTLTLSGTNTYTGGTTINSGRIVVSSAAPLSSGTIAINGTSTVGGQLYSAAALTFANNFVISGVGYPDTVTTPNTGRGGAIRAFNGQTYSGSITLADDSRIGYITGTAAATFSGQITGSKAIDFYGGLTGNSATQTFTLANVGTANNHTGNTSITSIDFGAARTGGKAVLQLGANEQIPNGVGKGNLVFNGADANHIAILELNGFSETVNGVSNVAATGAIIRNSISGASVLTLGEADTTSSFSGVISDGGIGVATLGLAKTGTGTLTLTGANTFSGDVAVNGGTLSATKLGASLNTRTITVATGATLAFGTGNVFGGHSTVNVPNIIVNGGTITNDELVIVDPLLIKVNNALGNVTLNSGTITATQGNQNSNIEVVLRPGEGYGAWGLNGTVTSTGTSAINTGLVTGKGGRILLSSNTADTVFDVTSGTLTVSAPLQTGESTPNYGLTKNGAGTLLLTAANIYTTNTTVNAGTLSLADNAQLKFVTGATSGTSNSIGGAGTLTVDGDFNIDTTLTDATALTTGSWTLVNTTTLAETFNPSFTIVGGGWTESANVWTKTVGAKKYTFTEATGTLVLSPGASYASWIDGFFPGETNLAIIGATADPDNDGIENGVEMVIGGNPATGMDTALLPTIEMVNADPDGDTTFSDYLLFTYRRSDLSVTAGVTADCETDTDLVAPWTAATGAPGVVIQVDNNFVFTPPAVADTDRVRVYVPRGANTKLFGRLDVVVP